MLKAFTYFQALVATANLRREEGQTMAEYGVVLAVICVAIIVALVALRTQIENAINAVVQTLTDNT